MKNLALALCSALLLCSVPAIGQEGPAGSIDIYEIIEQVADDIDKEIIVDPRLAVEQVVVAEDVFEDAPRPQAYTTADEIDYESLRAMLRAIGFVAMESVDQIRIVPEQYARAEPSRLLQEDDSRVSDHEMITRVITVPEGLQAAQLVPVLRPTMRQSAMMGAVSTTNQLYIVGYYDNVRRITAIIEEIAEGLDD